jgi:hypothetical protein
MLAIWPIATSSHFLEKLMKKCIRVTFALAILCAAMSTAALASENAYLYLVHGIPGHDYTTTTDPEFPVDVLLNDEICYQRGLAFGTITGPLTFAPGTYDVKISIADSLAPCTNSPLIDTNVTLDAGKNVSAVFALSQTGALTLSTFSNNFTTVPANDGRILLAQAADAPALTAVFQNTSTQKNYTYTANPGALVSEVLPAGNYTVTISEGTTTLVPATTVVLSSQSVTLLFAVGEASNNTVTLSTKTVKDVI